MKKLLSFLLVMAVMASCNKDEETPSIDLKDYKVSFTLTEDVDVVVDTEEDETVVVDLKLDKAAPEDVVVSLTVGSESTATEGTQFSIDSKELTILKDSKTASTQVKVIAAGVAAGESYVLLLEVGSEQVSVGTNNTLKINISRPAPGEPVVIFTEDFETGDFSPGWQSIDVDGNTSASENALFYPAVKWVVSDDVRAVHEGTYGAGSNSWVINASGVEVAVDNWLITSAIEIGTDNNLTYFWRSIGKGYPCDGEVYISTSNDIASFSTKIHEKMGIYWGEGEGDDAVMGWKEVSIDIPAEFANQTVYIAFRDKSEAGDGLGIDDISVKGVK